MASAKKTAVTAFVCICVSASLLLPLSSLAVVTFGYEEFGDSAGGVLWRATQETFHNSTVADVAENGTPGAEYAMTADQGANSWQRFARGQAAYVTPGKVLVYDVGGYTPSSDAQFSPLSFGGLWVKELQGDGTQYSIVGSGTRYTDFGNSGTNTLFRFDKSFTINRSNATRCYGNVTIDVAAGATFSNTSALRIEADSTLSLVGQGTVALAAGLNMNSSSTLDISAATRPTITGSVSVEDDSTIVLPAGTAVDEDVNIPVCSGTLSFNGCAYVKIGSAEAVRASVTTTGGAITKIETVATYTATIDGETAFSAIEWSKDGSPATIANMDIAILEISGSGVVTGLCEAPLRVDLASDVTLDVTGLSANDFQAMAKSSTGVYRWTANYPNTVLEHRFTYEYVGGVDAEHATTASLSGMRGTVKTRGFITINGYYPLHTASTLEVVSGKTWLGCNGVKAICGTITIREGATLVNTYPADALDYESYNSYVNVYGTLDMGSTRWTLWGGSYINIYDGGVVVGSGEDAYGALDWKDNATGSLTAAGTARIEAPVRIRPGANVTFNVGEGGNLTIAGTTIGAGKVTKAGAGTLTFAGNPAYGAGITANAGALVFDTAEDVTTTVTYVEKPTAAMVAYATQSNWKGTVEIPALVSASTAAADHVDASFLAYCGNENSVISLAGISGVTTYILASGNTTYNIGGVSIDGYTEFNNGASGSTANFAKITGGSDLCLGAWSIHSAVAYNLNEFNEYSGTLIVSNFNKNAYTFTVGIGNIVKSSVALGEPLLSHREYKDSGATDMVRYTFGSGKVPDDPSCILVNGVSTNLCFVKNDGIYIAAAKIGNEGYKSVQDAINARRRGKKGDIVIADGTAEIPEGYINYNGTVIRKAVIIKLH